MIKETTTCHFCDTEFSVLHGEAYFIFCPFCGEDISYDDENESDEYFEE